MKDDPRIEENRIGRWREWWRERWELRWRDWLAGAAATWAVFVPVAVVWFREVVDRPLDLRTLWVLVLLAVGLLVLSLSLFVVALDYRRRYSEAVLRRYMESLRRYTVGHVESLRERVAVLDATHARAPEVEASLSTVGGSASLGTAVQAVAPPAEVPPSPGDEVKELKTRERETLLKIIYGMAIAHPYNFNPDAKRGDAAPIIAGATDAAGCSVGDDTVRKWLKEAAKVAR